MQCEKGNWLAHGGASACKRAYKVACAVPVRKFNTAEDRKLKEENFKNINEDKKNIDQNPKEYLKLKDRKKI